MSTFATEIESGMRFEFGKNWKEYLSTLTDEKQIISRQSMAELLETDDLEGKTFLDIGSGSGLSSLSARSMGATVSSFDFDPNSVECTRSLKASFFEEDKDWSVTEGSVLDKEFLESLGQFDIVYSWGVLHHTGSMWEAISNASERVRPGGTFFIALYNDQGKKSVMWKRVKEIYCSGTLGRWAMSAVFLPYFAFWQLVQSVRTGTNSFREYKQNRGMNVTHDWYDWLGGLPFEVAGIEETVEFMRERGFELKNLKSANGSLGNNEFVFKRV
ncbi:MAG: class I SAM-dependent methyltransferase [Pyrinomonadaceae bacterium]